MKTRAYELGKDYPAICEWWRARKWPAVPCDALPTSGVIAEEGQEKLAAVFFYMIEGRWAWIDYLLTNPEAPLRLRTQAIELVVDAALKDIHAVKLASGFEPLIITCLNNENLIRIFEKRGFRVGDRNMTTLVGGLQ